MKAEKILLLGGSAQQVTAIREARNMGYETVLCDYLPDNPGQFAADHYYNISTTDRDAVLDIARKEQIDGILAYASDPAFCELLNNSRTMVFDDMPLAVIYIDGQRFFIMDEGDNKQLLDDITGQMY